MEWFSVILLIVVGVALVIIEIIFVPGATIVGVLGILCWGGGVYLGYTYFESDTGHLILGVGGVLCVAAVVFSFKTRAWDRFALKDIHTDRVKKIIEEGELSIGDEGKALSDLRPSGKAEFGDKNIEVTSLGNFVDAGTRLKVINLKYNKIIVEPIT